MSETAELLLSALGLAGVGRRTVVKAAQESRDGSDLSAFVPALFRRRQPPSDSEWDSAKQSAREQIDRAAKLRLNIVTFLDAEYPERLRTIDDPPACLFVKGPLEVLRRASAIAVVGTREPSTFAEKSARSIAKSLASEGAVIVSGLAKGCDSLAHEGCLDASGQTVAVMAHGLDRVYPSENKHLAERIVSEGGALVSEYSVGTPPTRNSFVDRDRLQSGLADAVFVVETSETGGTMHTARFACKHHRRLAFLNHPEFYDRDPRIGGNEVIKRQMGGIAVGGLEDLRKFHAELITAFVRSQMPVFTDSVRQVAESVIREFQLNSNENRVRLLRLLSESIEESRRQTVADMVSVHEVRRQFLAEATAPVMARVAELTRNDSPAKPQPGLFDPVEPA